MSIGFDCAKLPMAIAETNNNYPKLLPLTDSQGRHKKKRVAFSETIINHNYKIHKDDSPRCPPFRSVCFSCCSWTCLALSTLLLLLLVLGLAFGSILRSALPQIRITKFSPKLQISKHPNSVGQRALSYDLDFTVEFTNSNERVHLSYGSLAFQMSSLQMKLAQANVEGFSQATGNVTTLNVSTSDPNAGELKNSFNGSMMVVDILLTGYVKFYVGGLNTNRMPMEAKCGDVKQADGGSGTKCNVELDFFVGN